VTIQIWSRVQLFDEKTRDRIIASHSIFVFKDIMAFRVIAFEIDMRQLLYGGEYSNGRQTDRKDNGAS
jgi:hypothetical protein